MARNEKWVNTVAAELTLYYHMQPVDKARGELKIAAVRCSRRCVFSSLTTTTTTTTL